MEMNIRHAVIVGIGISRNTWDTINEIYSKDEEKYYSIYLKSDFYHDLVKKSYTANVEDIINKTIGIIEYCYIKKDFLLIEKIIRCIHPSIVNFAKKSNEINVPKFALKYMKEDMYERNEQEDFSIFISLIYLGSLYKKNVTVNEGIIAKTQGFWEQLLTGTYSCSTKYEIDYYNGNFRDKVAKYYPNFNYGSFENIKEKTLALFLENYIEKEVIKKLEEENIYLNENTDLDDYRRVRSQLFYSEGMIRYIGAFSLLTDTLGLNNLDIFNDIKMNNDILNMIIKMFIFAKEGNKVPDSEKNLYLVSIMYIYGLTELYLDLKDLYLNKSQVDKHKKILEMQSNLEETKNQYERKIQILKNKNECINKELKDLKNQVKILQADNKKLEDKNNKLKDEILVKNERVNNLQNNNKLILELVDNLEEQVVLLGNMSQKEQIEYINKFKIGIFGGQKKIKELNEILDNVVFYDSQNRDISNINNLDMIFINYDYFNHGFTNKITANNNSVPIGYISKTNNERIISMIYNALIKEYH